MPILVIDGRNFSNKLKKFDMVCRECGSTEITIEIDWDNYPSGGWYKITAICTKCHADETLFDE